MTSDLPHSVTQVQNHNNCNVHTLKIILTLHKETGRPVTWLCSVHQWDLPFHVQFLVWLQYTHTVIR